MSLFRKPFTLTGQNKLKSSAVRKLRQQLQEAYPGFSQDMLDSLLPPKCGVIVHKCSNKSLLYCVEDTSSDDSASSSSPNIIFFDATNGKGELYPTMETLWRFPSLMPALVTPAPVSRHLIKGADLMIPGIYTNRLIASGDKVQKGQRRCVLADGNPMPVAVGQVTVDHESMIYPGRKGKGLIVRHCYGDSLWAFGAGNRPPGFGKTSVMPLGSSATNEESKSDEDVVDSWDELADDDEDGEDDDSAQGRLVQKELQSAGATDTSDAFDFGDIDEPPESTASAAAQADSGPVQGDEQKETPKEDSPGNESGSDDTDTENAEVDTVEEDAFDFGDMEESQEEKKEEAAERTAEDEEATKKLLDATLEHVLLYTIRWSVSEDDLPIKADQLYSSMVARWASQVAKRAPPVDVKHSSYGKLAKFMKAMTKAGYISTANKASTLMVTAVNKQHSAVQEAAASASQQISKLFTSEAPKPVSKAGGAAETSKGDGKLRVQFLYQASSRLKQAIFASEPHGKLFTNAQAKNVLWDYVAAEDLNRPKGMVLLNGPLVDALYSTKGKKTDHAALPEEVSKRDLALAFEQQLVLYYTIVGEEESEVPEEDLQYKKGPVPTVAVTTEKRQGRKYMTTVTGLEAFKVDPKEYAQFARKKYACNTTTAPPQSGKIKGLLVQLSGDVGKNVVADLISRGLPAKYITLQLPPASKKKK